MAKASGLGDNFYIAGYDLSGDIASIDSITAPIGSIDSTAIKQLAHSRLFSQRDAAWSFTTMFESNTGVTSPGIPGSTSPLVSTYNFPVYVTVIGGTGTQVSINGVNQGSFDGTYLLPALGTIILTYSIIPTSWVWIAQPAEHQGLAPQPNTDMVACYFRGTAIGNPAAGMVCKQLDYDPTRATDGTLTMKVDLQSNGFGMEWGTQLTPGIRIDLAATVGAFIDQGAGSAFGAQAYFELLDFVGTSVTIDIQSATTSGGSYTTTGLTTTAMTALGAQRLATANNLTINEFIKVITTGTFTYAAFAVMMNRNAAAGQVF